MKSTTSDFLLFQSVVEWSAQFNTLPWRQKRTPYTTLISEMMLQQTTVGTVVSRFLPFIKKFPTLEHLAHSSEEEVLKQWQGLGYYSRAKRLHKMAPLLFDLFNRSSFPPLLSELLGIKGIGDYTAKAILCIGYNENYLPIDANIERILQRFYGILAPSLLHLKKILNTSFEEKKILPFWKIIGPQNLAEGLMDLGREICKKTKPQCFSCPLKQNCEAYNKNQFEQGWENKSLKKIKISLVRLISISLSSKNHTPSYFLKEKTKGKWLIGQYEIPTFALSSWGREEEYPLLPSFLEPIILPKISQAPTYNTTITQFLFQNSLIFLPPETIRKLEGSFLDPSSVAITSATQKALQLSPQLSLRKPDSIFKNNTGN